MKKFINTLVLIAVTLSVGVGCGHNPKPQVINASNEQTLVMQDNLGTFARVNNPANGQATWEQVGGAKPSAGSRVVAWLGSNWGQGGGYYAPRRSRVTRVYGSSYSSHFSAHAGYSRQRTGRKSHVSHAHAGTHSRSTSGPARSVSVQRPRSAPTYTNP